MVLQACQYLKEVKYIQQNTYCFFKLQSYSFILFQANRGTTASLFIICYLSSIRPLSLYYLSTVNSLSNYYQPIIILLQSHRDSTGITFTEENTKNMGQITTIYVVYLQEKLDNVFLKLKIYREANIVYYNNLFKVFHKEYTSETIIPIYKVLGHCFL